MIGMLPRHSAGHNLPCSKCAQFQDSDPDVFYCELQHAEFPGLCEDYQPRDMAQWIDIVRKNLGKS
jgi:hypothetical protein